MPTWHYYEVSQRHTKIRKTKRGYEVYFRGELIGLIEPSQSADRTPRERQARLTGYPNITCYGCDVRYMAGNLVEHHADQLLTNRQYRRKAHAAYLQELAAKNEDPVI